LYSKHSFGSIVFKFVCLSKLFLNKTGKIYFIS
jgi:hypothetical protein